MVPFLSKRLARAAALGGMVAGSVGVVACQALLDFTPAEKRGGSDATAPDAPLAEAGTDVEDAGSADATADASTDTTSDAAAFCANIPADAGKTFCIDFDDIPHPHATFTAGLALYGIDAGARAGPSVSPPKAWVIDIPPGFPLGDAAVSYGAHMTAAIDLAGAQTLHCEVAWKIENRPDAGDEAMDIMIFDFARPDGSLTNVGGVVELADGRPFFFINNDDYPFKSPQAGFVRGDIDFDFATGGNPTVSFRFQGGPDPPTEFVLNSQATKVLVRLGAYAVDVGPWLARYDNVYCVRTP